MLGYPIMAEIILRNLSKRWGSFVGVENLNLTVSNEEFLVLLGPSGCGKTTTMRMIAGLEEVTSGDIMIDGVRVNDLEPKDRNVSMVFQSYALYPNMNVYENIRFPLKVRKIPESEHKERVMRASSMVELDEFLHRKPAELSGGQRQRVALARAIVREPNVFLMDEPLSNLDAELRVHMRAEIAQLHRKLKTTFIYVTHDQAEAMTMADRVAVMMDGHLLQVDTPSKVYSDPTDIRVAEFIGSPKINILPGSVDDTGQVSVGGVTLDGIYSNVKGTKIKVGVRPEALTLVDVKSSGLPCHIVHHENLGSEAYFHAELEIGGNIICRMEASSLDHFTTGSKAKVIIDPKNALLFGEDGQRIISKIEVAA